jgi:hypothetical protein
MYKYLIQKYDILMHHGDNLISDIKNAEQYNIKTKEIKISALNEHEKFFAEENYKDFALLLREFRHKNPYEIDSKKYVLYNDQAIFNIPLLILISKHVKNLMNNEKRSTLLCLTRDGCLIKHIFSTIYPELECKEFHSSRIINSNYNEEYKEYVKSIYDDKKCIIFDLNGSFKSGRKLFMEIFGYFPRVHLFNFDHNDSKFEKLTFNNDDKTTYIEKLNCDVIGTMIGMEKGVPIRDKLEYSYEDAIIYKETVLDFCNYIKEKRIDDINYPEHLIEKFYNKIKEFKSNVTEIENMENYNKNNFNLLFILIIFIILLLMVFYLIFNHKYFLAIINTLFIKKKIFRKNKFQKV